MALVRVVILCHWCVPVLALHIHVGRFEFKCELIGQTHHITGPAVIHFVRLTQDSTCNDVCEFWAFEYALTMTLVQSAVKQPIRIRPELFAIRR